MVGAVTGATAAADAASAGAVPKPSATADVWPCSAGVERSASIGAACLTDDRARRGAGRTAGAGVDVAATMGSGADVASATRGCGAEGSVASLATVLVIAGSGRVGATIAAAGRLAIRRSGRELAVSLAETAATMPGVGIGVGCSERERSAAGAALRARVTRADFPGTGAASETATGAFTATGASRVVAAPAVGFLDRVFTGGLSGGVETLGGESTGFEDSLVNCGALAARLRAGRVTATSSSLKSRAFVIPYPLHPFIADCPTLAHYSSPL